jgi:hypothetical protein
LSRRVQRENQIVAGEALARVEEMCAHPPKLMRYRALHGWGTPVVRIWVTMQRRHGPSRLLDGVFGACVADKNGKQTVPA